MTVLAKGYIIKHRLFWAWEDEQEAAWLSEMSRSGWHLVSVKYGFTYQFVQGEPKNYTYQLDYPGRLSDKRNYIALFEDMGWEYLGHFFNWRYFRKEAHPNETAVIYSDSLSKIERNRRLQLLFLIIGLLTLSLCIVNLALSNVLGSNAELNTTINPANLGVSILDFVCALVLFYGFYRINKRNTELKGENH